MGEQGKMRLWFLCHTCLNLKKVFSKEIGKIGFMQNSLELHQPNMHIGFRDIPLSVHHSVTCQTPFSWNLTHVVAIFFLLQIVQMTSEVSFIGFEFTTNMFSPVAT